MIQPESTAPLTMVCQHPDWIIINKPAGIGMHTEGEEPGVVVLCEKQWQQKFWPVHRLDKVTSGLLILARSADAAACFSQLFEQHQIRKFYLARATGKPSKKQGWIKGDMEKARNGSWKLMRSANNPAITRFVSHFDADAGQRLFLLAPKTGRTHQLRVAMKSLGTAIDGDQRYKGAPADRTYLHAYALQFEYQGESYQISCAPAPPDAPSRQQRPGQHPELWPAIPLEWQAPWQLTL